MRAPQTFRAFLFGAGIAVLLAGAYPAAQAAGIEATIVDSFGFRLDLGDLLFKIKNPPGSGELAAAFDSIPLVSGGKTTNLWLAQVATMEFTVRDGGEMEVKAVLQGEGEKVEGIVEDTSKCYFEGVITKGDRKGRSAGIPLSEVKSITVLTKYQGTVGKRGNIIPMPRPNRDVLYVSSAPTGAQVWVKAFDCPAARVWPDYKSMGETPLCVPIGAGKYAVKVFVPTKLAGELKPSTKLGEDTNPFEHDWCEINFSTRENVMEAATYTVNKTDGKAATLIALFQKKGATLDEFIATLPEGRNFDFCDKNMAEKLSYQQVPKQDIDKIIEAMHRGGKVVWHGKDKSLMLEAIPEEPYWKIGGAMRPRGKN